MIKSKSTIKLYDNDSHEKTFTAKVLSCTPSGDFFKIELDRTIFFPEGGGQYADTGTLAYKKDNCYSKNSIENTCNVIDVHIENNIIYHYIDKAIEVGKEVIGHIDWDKRFIRMQNHSGEHIISGLIHKSLGFDNIGFHLGNDYVTCDYNGELNWSQIKEIEAEANSVVFNNLPIFATYPNENELKNLDYRSKLDLTENVRIVTIPGVDVCACCAPHVNTTGEIGLIKIVNFEKSHGGTRLHLRCGYLALADYDEKQDNILKIMDLMSAKQNETAETVEKLIETNACLHTELSQASVRLAEAKLASLTKVTGNLVVCLKDANTDTLRALANGGKQKVSGVFVALTNCEDGYRYMITANGLPLSKLAKDFNACLVGRGGGKNDMIQGVFSSALPVIEDFFNNWSYKN